MRRVLGAAVGAAVVVLVACADERSPADDWPTPSSGDASTGVIGPVPDAAATDAPPDAGVPGPECSPAGWCNTRVPGDTAFNFTDVWPLQKTAFASGMPTGDAVRGTIAEYDGAEWHFIAPLYDARVVWAPSEDEVWAGGRAYRGMPALKRGTRSAGSWTWSEVLTDEPYISGIWGAGPGDVYVLTSDNQGQFANRVHHVDAAGASTLVLEADPRSDRYPGLWIDHVVGTSANDVWIVGHRQRCAYLAHKADGAFVTFADAMPTYVPGAETCVAVGDALAWRDWFDVGAVHASAPAPGEVHIAIPCNPRGEAWQTFRAKLAAGGGIEITEGATFGDVAQTTIWNPRGIWSPAPGDVYVAGFGAVLRNPATFDDAGAFSYSSVMLRGSFLGAQFNAIRGTAVDNIWVVGDSYALHKTTP